MTAKPTKSHEHTVLVNGETYHVTLKQEGLLWKMQHGRSLQFYRVIGDAKFALYQGVGEAQQFEEFVDKRTVNALLKRKLIVFDRAEGKQAHSRTLYYRLRF